MKGSIWGLLVLAAVLSVVAACGSKSGDRPQSSSPQESPETQELEGSDEPTFDSEDSDAEQLEWDESDE